MKMSSKMERCGLSPMRKFNPLANEALARGIKIYHMNIGQPDVETPAPFYQALRDFADPVVSYAPAPAPQPYAAPAPAAQPYAPPAPAPAPAANPPSPLDRWNQ